MMGSFAPQLFDGTCGEPIGWGYKILEYLGDENRHEIQKYGILHCCYPNWYLITKKISREEAEKTYGKITNEEFGPRGGWRSATFGDKTFSSKFLE